MEGILNKKILIVDDDERMLRALDKTLRSEGAMVMTTQWAGEVIAILSRREPVDLVITDLRMPAMSGTMLVHSIQQMSPDLPIIVLTAFGSPEARNECFREGAAAFLEKNLSTAQLLAAIEEVFEWQKLRKKSSSLASASKTNKPDTKLKEEI